MEKIFISIIWALTSADDQDPRLLAREAASQLTDGGLDKLSEDATNASLILIWKYIEVLAAMGSSDIAEEWCCFALNLKQQVFQLTPEAETKFIR
ncbi:hypothetical protein BJX63DRAFT_312329 [Aspergillus granulosus]|uniref:Uncharacterized protein n=1 Tax=Aspergillus granulosus TaxID=176169 RepID=A0ABR4HYC9_9EURO